MSSSGRVPRQTDERVGIFGFVHHVVAWKFVFEQHVNRLHNKEREEQREPYETTIH